MRSLVVVGVVTEELITLALSLKNCLVKMNLKAHDVDDPQRRVNGHRRAS